MDRTSVVLQIWWGPQLSANLIKDGIMLATTPPNAHVLIPGTCEYMTWKDFIDVIVLRILWWCNYRVSGWAHCDQKVPGGREGREEKRRPPGFDGERIHRTRNRLLPEAGKAKKIDSPRSLGSSQPCRPPDLSKPSETHVGLLPPRTASYVCSFKPVQLWSFVEQLQETTLLTWGHEGIKQLPTVPQTGPEQGLQSPVSKPGSNLQPKETKTQF